MKVNVIEGGVDAFNAMMYQPPTQELVDYMQNNLVSAQNVVQAAGTNFLNNVQTMYDTVTSYDYLNKAKILAQQATMMINNTDVGYLSIDQIHTANIAMQQYILEDPYIRNLYDSDMCHGFQESYTDPDPNRTKGQPSFLYEQVMSGLSTVTPYDEMNKKKSDDDYTAHYTHSFIEELHPFDQMDIHDTMINARTLAYNGIDPTDPDQGAL